MVIGAEGWERPLSRAIISGDVAGDHTVPGPITPADALVAVHHVSADLVTNTDITSEFSITDANTINNAAGTDTTGNYLAIMWAEAI